MKLNQIYTACANLGADCQITVHDGGKRLVYPNVFEVPDILFRERNVFSFEIHGFDHLEVWFEKEGF